VLESCLRFVRDTVRAEEIRGRSVLEVGARAVQGAEMSVRPGLESFGPSRYIGVDVEHGPCVDEICDAGNLRRRFGDQSFDLVVTTEMLEHVRDWRGVIHNLKHVVSPRGTLVVTTRSRGFPHHAWPDDYWRYEPSDMKAIFSDFEIEALEPDPEAPGVFLKARRPADFRERDLSRYTLFSMVKQRRAQDISRRDERLFALAYTPVRLVRSLVPQPVKDAIKRTPLSREHRIQKRAKRTLEGREE